MYTNAHTKSHPFRYSERGLKRGMRGGKQSEGEHYLHNDTAVSNDRKANWAGQVQVQCTIRQLNRRFIFDLKHSECGGEGTNK